MQSSQGFGFQLGGGSASSFVLGDFWEAEPLFDGEAVVVGDPEGSVVAQGDDLDVGRSGYLDNFAGHGSPLGLM
jgi:hypothetical protein